MSLASQIWKRLLAAINAGDRTPAMAQDDPPFTWEHDERRDYYAEWEKLYANKIYKAQADGGYREVILKDVIGRTDYEEKPLHGFVNPVQTIVDAYAGVFRGKWGEDIKPAEKKEGSIGDPINPALIPALGRIWRASNLATDKQLLTHYAAKLGTVGLRIVAEPKSETRTSPRVRIALDHPSCIVDYEPDGAGNVLSILLEYKVKVGKDGKKAALGDKSAQEITYRELLTKTSFERMDENGNVIESTPNELGLCPYVVLRHKDVGARFGVPAFDGSEPIIHLINWIITRQHIAIDKFLFGRWFATGGGANPQQLDMDDDRFLYCQTNSEDPAPTLQHLAPKLDHQRVMEFWKSIGETLKERNPELLLNDVKVRSGQTGDALAEIMKPVRTRLIAAKDRYDDALKRAMQIAASWGIFMGMWDLGTGMGTRDAADRAFGEAFEDFDFAPREVLTMSDYDRKVRDEADTWRRKRGIEDAAAGQMFLSHRAQLEMTGMPADNIDKVMREKAEEDSVVDAKTVVQ